MKKTTQVRLLKISKHSSLWHKFQQIGRSLQQVDQLPDAAATRKAKPRSAPPAFVDMVF